MKSNIIEKYTNPSVPGAFSGLHSFKKNNSGVTKKILQSVDTYTLHKPVKRKFDRRKTFANEIDHEWQIDLIDMKKYKTVNSYYNYLLTCIDVFSRFAWVEPLKNKSSRECRQAFEKIFKQSNRKPKFIYSDLGNEFKGECRKFLKEQGIRNLDTKSIHKASMVERFNRTLKEKMFRYFTYTKRFRYIDVLQDLVDNYNNSYHRSIKTKPALVNKSNESKIFQVLYNEDKNYVINYAFNIGDYVREVVDKKIFEKGYTPNWSKEIYIIRARLPTNPPTYQIKGLDGKEYDWKYYKEELQKVNLAYDAYLVVDDSDPNYFKVNKLNTTDNNQETSLIEK